MLIAPIVIPIFFYNDDLRLKEDLGMDAPIEDAEVRDMHFYIINSVAQYADSNGDLVHTGITSGSSTYISPWNLVEVLSEIKKRVS